MLPPLKSQTALQVYDTNTIALPWPTGPAPRCLRLRPAPSESGCCARLPESAVRVLGCFGALERVVRTTYSSEFPQAQGNGWWNPARVAWVGPGEPDGPNSKNPKATARKRIEQPRKSSGGAEQQRRAPRRGRCRGRHWPMATGVARWLPHTHRPDLEAVGPVVASERKRRGEQASY